MFLLLKDFLRINWVVGRGFCVGLLYMGGFQISLNAEASSAQVPPAVFTGTTEVNPAILQSPDGHYTGTISQRRSGNSGFNLFAKGANPDGAYGEKYDNNVIDSDTLYVFSGVDLTKAYVNDIEESNSGEAGIQYYAEVSGPAGLNVPVSFAGAYQILIGGAEGSASASAGISVEWGVVPLDPWNPESGATVFLGSSFNAGAGVTCGSPAGCTSEGSQEQNQFFNETFSVPTNTIFEMIISASSGVIAGNVGGAIGLGASRAGVDPTLSISPAFLTDHPGLSLELSPNVTQTVGAVPEPTTWAMTLIGFTGLGWLACQRRPLLLWKPDWFRSFRSPSICNRLMAKSCWVQVASTSRRIPLPSQ